MGVDNIPIDLVGEGGLSSVPDVEKSKNFLQKIIHKSPDICTVARGVGKAGLVAITFTTALLQVSEYLVEFVASMGIALIMKSAIIDDSEVNLIGLRYEALDALKYHDAKLLGISSTEEMRDVYEILSNENHDDYEGLKDRLNELKDGMKEEEDKARIEEIKLFQGGLVLEKKNNKQERYFYLGENRQREYEKYFESKVKEQQFFNVFATAFMAPVLAIPMGLLFGAPAYCCARLAYAGKAPPLSYALIASYATYGLAPLIGDVMPWNSKDKIEKMKTDQTFSKDFSEKVESLVDNGFKVKIKVGDIKEVEKDSLSDEVKKYFKKMDEKIKYFR